MAAPATNPPTRPGLLYRALGTRSLLIGALLLSVIVAIAVIVPLLAELDPYAVSPRHRLRPPSADFWLGTDNFGRSIAARLLGGAQTSLFLGTAVAALSVIFGTVIGITAAFFRVLDNVLMRICDGLMAIPGILLAVALTASFGPNVQNLIIALTIVFTPNVARIVRARALAVKSETFVEASHAMGAGPFYIMRRHILPNTLSVLAVQGTFIFADTIIVEAALSFLGAGVPTPEPSWGNILFDGKSVITRSPWMVIFTSAALVITVIGLNLLGDGLRDLIDQRGRPPKRDTRLQRLLFGGGLPRPTPEAE